MGFRMACFINSEPWGRAAESCKHSFFFKLSQNCSKHIPVEGGQVGIQGI